MGKQRILLIVWLLASTAACSLVNVIPPDALTDTAMTVTQVRIHRYMLAHRDYPPNLHVLPRREGYSNEVVDGWGRTLIYAVDDNGIISLTSLGRDGKVGGSGEDVDVIKRFRTRREDGSLNVDDEYWIIESEIQDGL
jgi:hypothetical protein